MQVKFLDLRRGYENIAEEVSHQLGEVLRSGNFIGGNFVDGFEKKWAKYCGTKFCVGVGNGLDALILALKAIGVGQGDEVIVPANTFIATWLAVSHCGAKIVPVEPGDNEFNISASEVEKKITDKTKAIIPVHLYGYPVDMEGIMLLAKKYNVFVVEDAAQAHGAELNGKRIGGHGDIVAWSFYPGKNLGAMGDAGGVTTNNEGLMNRVRILGNYGSQKKYSHDLIGFNSRLDPIQAAVLSLKIKYLDEQNKRRQETAIFYADQLGDLPIKLPPIENKSQKAVFHQFIITIDRRDELKSYLEKQGIETMIHYPVPPFMQRSYDYLNIKEENFKKSKILSQKILSLPIDPYLDNAEKNYITSKIREFYGKKP